MMTQTHSLVAAALLASPERSVRQNSAILFGSFIPDLAIYALFIWSKTKDIPEQILWQELYFTEPMLTFTAIGNSAPLYASILLIASAITLINARQTQIKANSPYKSNCWSYLSNSTLALFAIAALTHLIGDFPVHASDAHPHFWPLTGWRFHSPVSYWDNSHHGRVFSLFEALLGIALSIIVFKRFKTLWVRLFTALAVVSYIAVPIYFSSAL